jgi:hypothetical protein
MEIWAHQPMMMMGMGKFNQAASPTPNSSPCRATRSPPY